MSETICLIDGDRRALKRNREILEMFGYRVIASARADIAFSRIMSGAVNLVISDVYLPGLSGIDLLEKMRRNRAETPVLLLGKSLTEEIVVKAADSGAIGFFEKPVSTVKMVAFIQELFRSPNGNGNGKISGNGKLNNSINISIPGIENVEENRVPDENGDDAANDGAAHAERKKKKRFFGLF